MESRLTWRLETDDLSRAISASRATSLTVTFEASIVAPNSALVR
jgi:hypothetical protein